MYNNTKKETKQSYRASGGAMRCRAVDIENNSARVSTLDTSAKRHEEL